MEQLFTDTTSTLARAAGVTTPTVVLYARLGLLEHVRASSGMRLFKQGQAEKVREIFNDRMAWRGRQLKP